MEVNKNILNATVVAGTSVKIVKVVLKHLPFLYSKHTSKSEMVMEKSVYITSLSALRGAVSISFDAMNKHTQPSSCNLDFLVWTDVRNRSRRFTDSGNTSSS